MNKLCKYFFFDLNKTKTKFHGRMIGMIRSVSKFPTYRRRFRQVVKELIIYAVAKEESSKDVSCSAAAKGGSTRSSSVRSVASIEIV